MQPASASSSSSSGGGGSFVDIVVNFTLRATHGPALHVGGDGQGMATCTMTYRVYVDGTLGVGCDLALSRQLPPLPRIGLGLTVGPAVGGNGASVEWFGRGPGESYPDRKWGNTVGRWHEPNVNRQFVPYLYPSENGSKAVRTLGSQQPPCYCLASSSFRQMKLTACTLFCSHGSRIHAG